MDPTSIASTALKSLREASEKTKNEEDNGLHSSSQETTRKTPERVLDNDNDIKPQINSVHVKDEAIEVATSLPLHMRKHGRISPSPEESQDNADIDCENVETPPIIRRAHGNRSFKAPANLNWLSSSKEKDDDFEDRRANRKFRSMTNTRQGRKALVGETPSMMKSDGEGDGGSPLPVRRLMKFKKLSDLAKDGDSETEQMLSKQSTADDLGDGNFQRFSSFRKTLHSKRGKRSSDERKDAVDSGDEKDSRLKRWQRLKDFKLDGSNNDDNKSNDDTSLKEKITRKLFPSSDKYDLEKASSRLDPKPPSSEILHRKRPAPELRGSFRQLGSNSGNSASIPPTSRTRRGDRNKTAIDPHQVKEAMNRNNIKNVTANGSISRRRGDSRSLLARSKASSKEDDEGFEENLSLKSETASLENGYDTTALDRKIISRTNLVNNSNNNNNSLRSSKSSLTSATSVNTVRQQPIAKIIDRTPSLPIGRSDSVRSQRLSSVSNVKRTPLRSASNASNLSSRRPTSQPRSSSNLSPLTMANGTDSNVRRQNSGSRKNNDSKENLFRSNSGASSTAGNTSRLINGSKTGSAKAKTLSNNMTGSITRRTPRPNATLPAFMRPTTASASKKLAEAENNKNTIPSIRTRPRSLK